MEVIIFKHTSEKEQLTCWKSWFLRKKKVGEKSDPSKCCYFAVKTIDTFYKTRIFWGLEFNFEEKILFSIFFSH